MAAASLALSLLLAQSCSNLPFLFVRGRSCKGFRSPSDCVCTMLMLWFACPWVCDIVAMDYKLTGVGILLGPVSLIFGRGRGCRRCCIYSLEHVTTSSKLCVVT